MSRSVKPRRRYESPRRREQAAATRQAILEAAERLFAKQGYVGTSVAEIAEEARVALKTVYAVFGTKAEVLRGLWNLRMRGDEEPVPMPERPWYRAIVDEPDPHRRLALVAHNSRIVHDGSRHRLDADPPRPLPAARPPARLEPRSLRALARRDALRPAHQGPRRRGTSPAITSAEPTNRQ